MFTNVINSNFYDSLKQKALNGVITKTHKKYKPILDVVYSNMENNIISNINSLLENTTNDLEFDIYSELPKQTSINLADRIKEKTNEIVKMKQSTDSQYIISVNGMSMITVNLIQHKSSNIIETTGSIKINSTYHFPILVELMDLYRKLYSPTYVDEWEELYNTEIRAFSLFNTERKINGGAKCVKCKEFRHENIESVKIMFMDFLINTNYVLIGNWVSGENTEIIKIISENEADVDLLNITNYLSNYTKFPIYYKEKMLYIPKDNRIKRHRFYIRFPTTSSDVEKPFLDIYNCGTYELIPYNIKKNIKIGTPPLLLRFLFIDLWILQLLSHVDKKIIKSKTNDIHKQIAKIHKTLKFKQVKTFIGIEDNLLIKIQIENSSNPTSLVYYPR
jgi:hypothetical protein